MRVRDDDIHDHGTPGWTAGLIGRTLPCVTNFSGRTLGLEEAAAVTRVLESGILSSVWGTEVHALEHEMAERFGVTNAVACSSGTAAIHLAMAAAAISPGDEVITTPISDFGSVAPILAQNAVPVFADVDPATGNLDPSAVQRAIGPHPEQFSWCTSSAPQHHWSRYADYPTSTTSRSSRIARRHG